MSLRSLLHLGGRRAHCLQDVLVARAAAKVGREDLPEVRVADVRLGLEHAGGQHQEARRAEAALQAVVLPERLLQRMERLALREAFDGADLRALRLHGEHEAGTDRLAVHQHGAGAAHAVLAAEMRAGQPAVFAQRIGEIAACGRADFVLPSVHLQCESERLTHAFTSRSFCRMRGGVTGISKNSMPKGESASTMALTTAAGAPIAPPSPTPFALVMLASDVVS